MKEMMNRWWDEEEAEKEDKRQNEGRDNKDGGEKKD